MATKKRKKAPYAKGTQSMALNNPYQSIQVQSNNPGFNFPGAIS